MQIFHAADYGVLPGRDAAAPLAALFEAVRETPGEKTVRFLPGVYPIASDACQKRRLFITNTAADSEYTGQETPHLGAAALFLSDVCDTNIEGNGAVFVLDGKATNLALVGCKRIAVENLEFRHAQPDMHTLTVTKKGPFSVDFEVDRDTSLVFENGKPCFIGRDYRVFADAHAASAHWIGLIRTNAPQDVRRVCHPLLGAVRLTETGERRFRAYFPCTARFHMGDRFVLFDVRRQHVGIFVDRCENVRLSGLKQRFNYGLALVCQCSRDITLSRAQFAPEPGSARPLASVADFVQLCMCRGKITIADCLFCGAGDDGLNVHGIHFSIARCRGSVLTLRFMHPQTHGFDPFLPGDTVAWIDPKTLLETGRAQVAGSRLLSETEIELTLETAPGADLSGLALENVSACPDLDFCGNTLSRIITRGVLLTTRGRVRVVGNRFVSTSMSGVLLSDDAKSWYESGMCKDVLIKSNVFTRCGETPIRIKPENSRHRGPVHQNIRIEDNTFTKYPGCWLSAKSTDGLYVRGNRTFKKSSIRLTGCTNVKTDETRRV